MKRELEELAAYFYKHVFLAFDRYRKIKQDKEMGSNRDRAAALNAAASLYHFREHVPDSLRRTRSDLAAICPDYDLLGDIVNASKHNTLTKGSPRITGADDIYEMLICTTFRDEDGEYQNHEKNVEVKLKDASTRDVYEILTNTVNMWFDELHRIGATDKREPISHQMQAVVPRSESSRMNLQLTKGLRWRQRFRFRRYNSETSKLEPVDLSDRKQLAFSLYKPRAIDVELRDSSGATVIRQMQITADQEREFRNISDSTSQEEYLLRIAIDQGIASDMVSEYQKSRVCSADNDM